MTSPYTNKGSTTTDGVQIWERAWTTDEMRQHSADWSLAGDAGLLQYLQKFSQNMISQTHEMTKMMNILSHETKITSSKVSNIINDFHMLSNTQFVESRVYDEEVLESPVSAKPVENTKTKEQKEAEVILKISEALNSGLVVLDCAFDHIVQDADSDDENPPQVILRPKDPYAERRLPHLIGSPEFLADDFVGIADLIKPKEEKEEKVDVYESEEELPDGSPIQDFGPLRRPEDFGVDSDDGLFLKRDAKENNEDSQSFSSKDSTDELDQIPVSNTLPTVPLSAPLLAEIISSQAKGNKKKASSDDLFGGLDLPEEEEEDTFFRGKGIFSGGAFDKEDVFDDVPKTSSQKNISDDILFGSEKNVPNKKLPAVSPVPVIPIAKQSGLFDSEDEDDIFGIPSSRKPSSVSIKSSVPEKVNNQKKPLVPPKIENKAVVSSGLFDSDEDEGLFGSSGNMSKAQEPKNEIKEKKIPTGGIPGFSSFANELGTAIKNHRRKDSGSEEEDIVIRPDSSISNKSASSFAKKESSSNNSLFVDEPDELFSRKESSNPITKSSTKDSLFGDDIDDDDNLFTAAGPISQRKNLFVDSEKKNPDEKKNEEKKNILNTKVEEKKKEATKKISLFDDEDDGDDLFSFPSKRSQSPGSFNSKTSETTPTVTSGKNLLSENQEEPVTQSVLVVNHPHTEEAKVRSASLFDEDKLFAGATEESPEVDLFSEKASVNKSKDQIDGTESAQNQKKRNSINKPIGGVALFGGVDLFGEHLMKTRSNSNKSQADEETGNSEAENAIKVNQEISVSFDEPVDTSKTLPSAAKDRVKVQVKRRPPSRKGRQVAKNPSVESAKAFPNVEEEKEKKDSLLKVVSEMRSPSTEEEDLFPVNEHLTNQLYVENVLEKKLPREERKDDDGSIFEDDELFKKCAKPKSEEKNIFEDSDEIFSVKLPAVSKAQAKSFLAEDDDDIFDGDIFQSSSSSTVKTLNTQTKSIFDDDDGDDIFSSPPVNLSNPKPSTVVTTAPKKKETFTKKSLLPSKDIFDDPLLSAQNE